MCGKHINKVLDFFQSVNENQRPGLSWPLGRYGGWDLRGLLKRVNSADMDMRQWAAYIIGNTDQKRIIKDIEALKQNDPETYFAVTVLWKITSSWVYQLKEYYLLCMTFTLH